MQEPELRASIQQLQRNGGQAQIVGTGSVWPQPDGLEPRFKSVHAKAVIKLPVVRPKNIKVVLSADAEYEYAYTGLLPLADTTLIRKANAAAYWLAVENLKMKFIQEIKESRAGIQDKRVNNLVKVWITPLTRAPYAEETT